MLLGEKGAYLIATHIRLVKYSGRNQRRMPTQNKSPPSGRNPPDFLRQRQPIEQVSDQAQGWTNRTAGTAGDPMGDVPGLEQEGSCPLRVSLGPSGSSGGWLPSPDALSQKVIVIRVSPLLLPPM